MLQKIGFANKWMTLGPPCLFVCFSHYLEEGEPTPLMVSSILSGIIFSPLRRGKTIFDLSLCLCLFFGFVYFFSFLSTFRVSIRSVLFIYYYYSCDLYDFLCIWIFISPNGFPVAFVDYVYCSVIWFTLGLLVGGLLVLFCI